MDKLLVGNVSDVVVVGGGPAGSFSALELARRGVSVSLFEEHGQVGIPSHCAGHLSIRSLRRLGLYPLPKGVIENVFSAANFYSPKGGRFRVQLAQPITCAVNRARFDKFLADRAEDNGVCLNLNHRVQSLIIEEGVVKGVIVISDETEKKVSTKLVVDAEGISSRLIRQAGLPSLRRGCLVYAVEAEVENVEEVEEQAVEVYLGSSYAPGFYGWLIPKLDGTAKVGLATRRGNPNEFLQRLMQRHPVAAKQLKNARIKQKSFHTITLGGPISRAYTNGFLAVGDCASQVKPTTGGGVIFSLTCARMVAEIGSQALANGDVSNAALVQYQRRIADTLGFDVKVMLRARRVLDRFSDEKLDNAIRFAGRMGLDKALSDVDEIDFQGRTLLTLMRKPASYAAAAYLLSLYFSTNA